MRKNSLTLGEGLIIVIGDRAARLTPSAGFTLAQRLIRRSTSELIAQQAIHDRMSLHLRSPRPSSQRTRGQAVLPSKRKQA
jgi:hypothetical protein